MPGKRPPSNRRAGYTIRNRRRKWIVIDPRGEPVCLTVYKRGAVKVVRRLGA